MTMYLRYREWRNYIINLENCYLNLKSDFCINTGDLPIMIIIIANIFFCFLLRPYIKKMISKQIVALAFLLCLLEITEVFGHGKLIDPPNRSSMWRYGYPVPPNYDDNGIFCGGRAVSRTLIAYIVSFLIFIVPRKPKIGYQHCLLNTYVIHKKNTIN